jgi:hypothetical protein
MSTTLVFVEMLIIGFFTAIWLVLFLWHLSEYTFQMEAVKDWISKTEDWVTPILLIAGAFFYLLGLLMNSLSHSFMGIFLPTEKTDKAIHSRETFALEVTTVYQKGSADLIRYLESSLTFLRLARAGFINFLLIAIMLTPFGQSLKFFMLLSVAISFGCFLMWHERQILQYKNLKYAYQIVNQPQVRSQPRAAGSGKKNAEP